MREGHACGMRPRPRTPNAAAGMLLAVGSAQGADALTFVRMVRDHGIRAEANPFVAALAAGGDLAAMVAAEGGARGARRRDLRGRRRAAPARGVPGRHVRRRGRARRRVLERRGDRRAGAGADPQLVGGDGRLEWRGCPAAAPASSGGGRHAWTPPPASLAAYIASSARWRRSGSKSRSPGTMSATPTDAPTCFNPSRRDVGRGHERVDPLGEGHGGRLVADADEQHHELVAAPAPGRVGDPDRAPQPRPRAPRAPRRPRRATAARR